MNNKKLFTIKGKISPLNSNHTIKTTLLSIEAIMPDHHHGMNVAPVINMDANGNFTANGMVFHMKGKWLIHFYLKHDYINEVAYYEINI